jgi:hypothetical protein
MRTLLKVSIPVEQGNAAAKSGVLQRTIQSTLAALKPEAAYFYPEDGKRTTLMIFDLQGSWQLPATVEPLFEALGASVHLTPVMNSEDLARGFKEAGM